MAIYGFAVIIQGAVLACGGQTLASLGAVPLIVLTHILYGVGFWRGLFTRLKPSSPATQTHVLVEVVPR